MEIVSRHLGQCPCFPAISSVAFNCVLQCGQTNLIVMVESSQCANETELSNPRATRPGLRLVAVYRADRTIPPLPCHSRLCVGSAQAV
jgi:hypothetical protein